MFGYYIRRAIFKPNHLGNWMSELLSCLLLYCQATVPVWWWLCMTEAFVATSKYDFIVFL